MKKLAILFLLTVVLVSFTFGQSVKADLSFGNLSEANGGDIDPKLGLIFAADGSKELGPGSLKLGLELAPAFHFTDKVSPAQDLSGDDNFVYAGYALPLGPGTLGFTLKYLFDFPKWILEPAVDYTGLEVSIVTLGFGAWYDLKTLGVNDDGDGKVFGKGGLDEDEFGLWVDAKFDFGLYIKYKFVYGIGVSEIAKIVYLDVNYQVMEALKVGVELDDTHKNFKAFTLKPYAEYALNDNVSLGAYFKVQNIGADDEYNIGGGKDIQFAPGVWIKYAL